MNTQTEKRFLPKLLGQALLALLIQSSTLLVYSQAGRPLKPFQEWSKKEAQQILEDSPWAPKQEVRLRYTDTARRIAGGTVPSATEGALINTPSNQAEMGGAEAPIDFQFTLHLRSALTVRQALVRIKQLEMNYDQMAPKDRAAFDTKYKGLFNENGEPLLTSTDTELIVNFTNNDVNMNTNFTVNVTKLTVAGQVDF